MLQIGLYMEQPLKNIYSGCLNVQLILSGHAGHVDPNTSWFVSIEQIFSIALCMCAYMCMDVCLPFWMLWMKRILFQWRIDARRMFTPCTQHTNIFTHTRFLHTQTDQLWTSLLRYLTHWEWRAGCLLCLLRSRKLGLCLSDVTWLLTEVMLSLVFGIKVTFRGPS